MRKTAALAAVMSAVLSHSALAQTDLLEAQQRLCELYSDVKKEIACRERVLRDAEAELARLELQQARREASLTYLLRHGIIEPDIDAKFEVARRQQVLFAVILSECLRRSSAVDDLSHCLDQREKAETWLGNKMNEPQ